MTPKEQNAVMDRFQSIAQLAIGAQTCLDHSSKLDLLQSAVNDIESDLRAISRIVDPYAEDPSTHDFKPSPGFSEMCAICGESPRLHERENA